MLHQLDYIIAVIVSNAISAVVEPSFFTNIINIKKLPFLPDIMSSSSNAYHYFVEDFMNSDVKYVYYGMTYTELKMLMKEDMTLKVFPLVDNSEQMILLGSIQRNELVATIEKQIGMDRRLEVKSARRRNLEVERKRKMRDLQMKNQEQKIKILEEELEKAKQDTKTDDNSREEDNLDKENNNLLSTVNEAGRRPSRFAVSSVTESTSPSPSRNIKGILKHSVSDVHATITGAPIKQSMSPQHSINSLPSAVDKWR